MRAKTLDDLERQEKRRRQIRARDRLTTFCSRLCCGKSSAIRPPFHFERAGHLSSPALIGRSLATMTPVLKFAAHLTIQGRSSSGFRLLRAGFPRIAHPRKPTYCRRVHAFRAELEATTDLRLMEKGCSSVRYDGRGGLGDVRRPGPGHQRVWCVRTKADVSLASTIASSVQPSGQGLRSSA
jgi:hypothetical protein